MNERERTMKSNVVDFKAFWHRLEAVAQLKGYTIATLADLSKVPRQTIYSSRRDNRLPGLEDAASMANLLEVPLEYLLSGRYPDRGYTAEMKAVAQNEELQDLVRLCQQDPQLRIILLTLLMKRRGEIRTSDEAPVGANSRNREDIPFRLMN